MRDARDQSFFHSGRSPRLAVFGQSWFRKNLETEALSAVPVCETLLFVAN